MNQKEKLLWGVIAVLGATQLLVLWSVFRPSMQPQGPAGQEVAGAPSAPEATTTPPVLPGSSLALVRGKVQLVSGQTLTLSTSEDGSTAAARITPETRIVKSDGSQKDPGIQKAELDAYNAKIDELRKDEEKNRAALETLMMPNPFVEKAIQLSDIKAGDSVTVFSFNKNSDGSYDARQVVVLVSTEAFRQ